MKTICVALFLTLAMNGSTAADTEFAFSGYLKSFAIARDEIDIEDFPFDFDAKTFYQSQNGIRLMFEAFQESGIAWQLHYEVSPIYGSSNQGQVAGPTFQTSSNSYRLADMPATLGSSEGKRSTFQNLDRLNVQINFEHGDLTIGRQAVSFGMARIINPTDVFLPFNVQTLNTEYRTGIDAIRFQAALGELTELDVGVILGEDSNSQNSGLFSQFQTNVSGTDFNVTLMRFSEQNLFGAGLQTALGTLGFWLEAARVDGEVDYTRASAGLDYAFNESVFAMIEYHFNGAGSDDPKDYLALLQTLPYQKAGVFLVGRHYLIPSVSFTVSPLLSVGVQSIVNLDDQSAFFSISGEFSWSENLYSSFGIYYFRGDELAYNEKTASVDLRSEYGASPNLVFASLRYYF